MERLKIISLDELASNWQIPVDRVKYFITDCGMDPTDLKAWFEDQDHWKLLIEEKKKVFDNSLFPGKLRPEPTETTP